MTPIPPVEERQVRPCETCICYWEAPCWHDGIGCKLDSPVFRERPMEWQLNAARKIAEHPCNKHYTVDEWLELVDQHNQREDIRPIVTSFVTVMEAKLKQNDHKDGWGNDSVYQLLSKLETEVTELKYRLDDGDPSHEISLECADIANFAMMIADNYTKQEEGE